MSSDLVIIAALVAVSIVLARFLSTRWRLPPLPFLVLLGMLVGILPWVPVVSMDPYVVLTVLIPPLLYHHATTRSAPRESRAAWRPIMFLGVGLTLATAGAVTLVAHLLLPGLPWGAALTVGAAFAPTQALVLDRLGAPERVLTVLRGESLINEGVAVVLLAIGLEQLKRPETVSVAALQLAGAIAGGALAGLALGWVVVQLRRRLADSGTLIVLSLATPFVAEISASKLGLSGPLAVTAAGFYVGARGRLFHTPARATERITWQVLTFLLGGTLAVLLGLQLRDLGGSHSGLPLTTVLLVTAALLGASLLVRLAFALAVDRHNVRALTLGGTRGASTLAIALAIPALPAQDALIFAAASVVLVSGFALLTCRAAVPESGGVAAPEEEARARQAAAAAAMRRLDQISHRLDTGTLWAQRQLLAVEANAGAPHDLRDELARAQRETLGQMYTEGRIGATTLHKLTEEIDWRDPHATTPP
ncbi:cation:proton antiporter [Nonomuraea sp. NPDC059023]|uniref:cation:proton antiporter domain-containing protein n=1 Tax=unclassified Nonomuraea TaxID=2593643 RepID=UPI0036A121D9